MGVQTLCLVNIGGCTCVQFARHSLRVNGLRDTGWGGKKTNGYYTGVLPIKFETKISRISTVKNIVLTFEEGCGLM